MGVVYRAEDLRLGRKVALKFLPHDARTSRRPFERFRREARTASALNHPQHLHDPRDRRADGRPFIAMELLEGRRCSRRSRAARSKLGPAARLAVADCRRARRGARRGIIHRDIKPANIFVTARGARQDSRLRPGQASGDDGTAIGEHDRTGVLTHAQGRRMGTVAYMSPEQARGEELDARTDLFSFGIVLYEMATEDRCSLRASTPS